MFPVPLSAQCLSRLFQKTVSLCRSSERRGVPTPEEEGTSQVGMGRWAMLGVRSHRYLLYNISLTCLIGVYTLFYVIYFTIEVKSAKREKVL